MLSGYHAQALLQSELSSAVSVRGSSLPYPCRRLLYNQPVYSQQQRALSHPMAVMICCGVMLHYQGQIFANCHTAAED